MKKILVLLLGLVVLFIPVKEEVFAEEIMPLTLGKGTTQYYSLTGEIYGVVNNTDLLDGNRNTMASFTSKRHFTVNLDQTSDIKKIHAEMLSNYSDVSKVSVSFYRNRDAVDLIQTMRLTGRALYSNNVDVRNVQSIRVSTINDNADNMRDFIAYGISSPVEHIEITDLTNSSTIDSVRLNWTNPETTGFTGVKIYRNDSLISSIAQPATTFTDNNVEEGENYTYKVTSKFTDGHETPGIITNAVVPRTPVLRITDLTHSEDHTKVKFEWTNPRDSTFNKIRIYRDNRLITASVTDNTFTDEDIRPGTTYNYRFEIVNNASRVFQGGELRINVPEAPPPPPTPPPVIEGGGFEQQPNGDYTATWETPVTGEIRVYVGGSLYRTIPASNQSITIPAADMVYTFIGDPDVRLQPVAEDGTEGEEESPPPTLDNPFSIGDLIGTGNGLLLYLAPLLLLALSFLLVPKLRNMIFSSFGNKKPDKESSNGERRTEQEDKNQESVDVVKVKEKEERKRIKEKKEQHQGKEYLAKLEKNESKEILKQEKTAERKREPRESRIRSEKQSRYQKEARIKREPRERFRVARESREAREPRNRRER